MYKQRWAVSKGKVGNITSINDQIGFLVIYNIDGSIYWNDFLTL